MLPDPAVPMDAASFYSAGHKGNVYRRDGIDGDSENQSCANGRLAREIDYNAAVRNDADPSDLASDTKHDFLCSGWHLHGYDARFCSALWEI